MAISSALVAALRTAFRLDWHGIHGVSHWARVRVNGLLLARMNGADSRVLEYFAFLHDACRHNDGRDPDHGPRAAAFAQRIRGHLIDLADPEFDRLVEAIGGHTHGTAHADITIASCWDADRLDLPRIGVDPDPARLCTDAGKRLAEFRQRAR